MNEHILVVDPAHWQQSFCVCPGELSVLLPLLPGDVFLLLAELLGFVFSLLEKWQQHR
jgi:hypothetical protein